MTDKTQILAYLAQVQSLQITAKKFEIVIDYDPKDCSIRIQMFDLLRKRHCYSFWGDLSYEENQREKQHLINDYNRYEHGNNNRNSNNR